MPFTLSHVAVVVPLQRAGLAGGSLVTSAWVFGAMSPDLFYFAKVVDPQLVSYAAPAHSWPGVLVLAPLAGGAALVWWWAVMAPALRTALSPQLVERLGGALHSPELGKAWPVATYAALVAGALTHAVWDSYTHAGRGLAISPDWLISAQIAGYPAPRVLQAASTVVGGAVVVWWLDRTWRGIPAAPRSRIPDSVALTLGTAAVAGVWITQVAGSSTVRSTAISAVLTVGGVAAIGATALALGWRALSRVR